MLILSRRSNEEIRFPSLDISIKVVKATGSVKLGIQAPPEVRVVRHELDNGEAKKPAQLDAMSRLPAQLRHEIRNHLNSVSVGLHLFKQQVDLGRSDEADETFEAILKHIDQINKGEAKPPKPADKMSQMPRTLVIEDEANEREMLAGFLRLSGHEVITANDGVEAFEYLTSHETPDFVLLDMRMPTGSGTSVLEWLRTEEKYQSAKVFVISGTTPEENGFIKSMPPVDRWFSKPLDPRTLVKAMSVDATAC